MLTGKLFYNSMSERLDILLDNGTLYGGLHCGRGLKINKDGKWIDTRVEFSHESDDWYLVGLYRPGEIPYDLRVRIEG